MVDVADWRCVWVRFVWQKVRRELLLKSAEKPGTYVGHIKHASLYTFLTEFASHGCSDSRDKVIGFLGLLPDDAAHLIDYSMPIEEYFSEVRKYTFATPKIKGSWAKSRFQRILGENLGLSASMYIF
jgi:hypothetical protein